MRKSFCALALSALFLSAGAGSALAGPAVVIMNPTPTVAVPAATSFPIVVDHVDIPAGAYVVIQVLDESGWPTSTWITTATGNGTVTGAGATSGPGDFVVSVSVWTDFPMIQANYVCEQNIEIWAAVP